ncbi:type II toxin-antitoxin system HicB family antitoxin [Variovorax sp. J22R24]|uniref:type II toxin-antitoxin system HicB family antitoxin n=1 Tax=Variovorax gracilis TaxID=3053502 RepID=UPI002577F782|nr:type II toxin-antitoxin system HicB family antitoxin [Variovorax sp. J22R24]MDM0109234.1 type II toxin-antitoxin system HicB family antitoxin [Variovorax sp. J22R24]
MFSYPASVIRDGEGFVVSFPDIPEALAGATERDEAISLAANALRAVMDVYFEDRRPVPPPSEPKRGQITIDLPPSVAAKVLLLNEMIAQGKRPAELARLMSARPQEVTRLIDLHHPTKIDTVAAALRALGRRLDLSLA